MIRRYNYTIDYSAINLLVSKARTFNGNANFKTNLFRPSATLDSKCKELFEILFHGMTVFREICWQFKKNNYTFNEPPETEHLFLTTMYNAKFLQCIPTKLSTSLEDFINEYCKFLDKLKFVLNEIKPTKGETDNFKDYVNSSKIGINISIFNDIWDLWNMSKHREEIHLTPYTIDLKTEIYQFPKLKMQIYSFKKKQKTNLRGIDFEIDKFVNDHLNKLIDLFDQFILNGSRTGTT